jgi:protein-disulfide isomerase
MKKAARLLLLLALALLVPHVGMAQPVPAAARRDLGPVPVEGDDPTWGDEKAPVTIVVFTDFQCPYCKKLHATLADLKQQYGDKKLRLVYKHMPLAMHPQARSAADTSAAVWALSGDKAFFTFAAEAFERLNAQGTVGEVVSATGTDAAAVQKLLAAGKPQKKVDADLALATKLDVTGTPSSFVNGVRVGGAESRDKLAALVDEQLKAAADARNKGVAAADVYVHLAKQNYKSKPKSAAAKKDESTVWKVPVGTSPVRGPKDALVTLVVFSDFQCPYCSKLAPTLDELLARYPKELRVVFKNNPLPMHERAEPAHQLALHARAKKGDAGFWTAHDILFAHIKELEDQDLERYAAELGLDPKSTMAAVAKQAHARIIEADQALADDLEADGTPTSFVNGRRFVGSRPVEAFATIIDEEIKKAQELVQKGTPAARVYDAILKGAKTPELELEQKQIPAPTKQNPVKGPKNAPVTMHMFTDFQCPFCGRVQDTLADLEKELGTQVRIVFHHRPLDSHPAAMLAHEAAAEAFRQGGNAAFWKMHDKIFADQSALDRGTLVGYAKAIGLDVGAFESALDSGRHQAAIEADIKVAEDADINGTPTFVVNGGVLGGAQPLKKFRRAIKQALRKKRG